MTNQLSDSNSTVLRLSAWRGLWLSLLSGASLLLSFGVEPAFALDAEAKTDSVAAAEVDGLLAAGEFGAAADVAQQSQLTTREQLLERVIFAQIENQEVAGARTVLQQMGTDRMRVNAEGHLAKHQLSNGGANFMPLMQLIQTVVPGPWFQIDSEGGDLQPFMSGIKVDPNGVLTTASREDETGRLAAISTKARVAALNEDMARASSMRLVSLTRLEREVSRRLQAGKPVVESMKQLAGLSQIQYVFLDAEQGEIVIGGPASGWRYDERGEPISLESGRPTLQLQDLVTVLRTFSPNGQSIFSCSIDPRQENLKAVMEFVNASQAKGALRPGAVRNWANRIGDLLGTQDITVNGVPGNSRVARVMVEADYRMKLIGIGKIDGGSNVPDYFELLRKDPSLASGSLDALRWWMTMQYDSVLHSADYTSFEIRGSAVKCLSENQFLTSNGQRNATGKAEPINRLFAANFTKHYQELAEKDPIFADLQGIFDLAMVAAIIQRDRLDVRAHWDRGSFAVNGDYLPPSYATPTQTDSVIAYRVFNRKDIVLQVAGGVRADLASVLRDATINQESPRLNTVAQSAKAPELPAGRWWWDAQ